MLGVFQIKSILVQKYQGHCKTDDNVGKLKQIRSSDNEERLHNSFVC